MENHMMKLAFIKISAYLITIFFMASCNSEKITIYPIDNSPNKFEQIASFKSEDKNFLGTLNTWKGNVDIYNLSENGEIFSSLSSPNNEFDQFNSFFVQNKDSIFCTSKYSSFIQLFDFRGKHIKTFKFKDRELNHFSNYRNQASFYRNKFYLTEIDSTGILNQTNVSEAIMDLRTLKVQKIQIPFPSDYPEKVGLTYTMPSKILVEDKLIYLFPGSDYLGFLDLNNLDFSYREMNLVSSINFDEFHGDLLSYKDNYDFHAKNGFYSNLKFSEQLNTYLLSIKSPNIDQLSIALLDQNLNQLDYFKPSAFYNKSIFVKDDGFYLMFKNQYDTTKCVFQKVIK